ncbi:MAG: sialate O-acetylesterase [Eubacteriales bacterium]|nr:sialate O-acetylesterase [Eubacteriales bacterium]
MMRFDKAFTDFMTFQRGKDGYAEIAFFGSYESTLDGVPYIRATQELTGQIAFEMALPPSPSWVVTFRLPAGVYRIECGTLLDITNRNPQYLGRGQVLRHIGVGEIYAIAGQSNAAGYGLQNEIDSKDSPMVGVSMKNDSNWQLASHPIGQMNGNIPCADMLSCGHSPWLRFARYILDEGIPVGLIPTARNGTSISEWQPGKPLYEYLIKQLSETCAGHLIWMQGCNDVHAESYRSYEDLFSNFLHSVRQLFPELDITIIQISGTEKQESYIGWKTVRDAQRTIADTFNCRLVPSYDLSDYSDDIHLSGKSNLRLAHRVFEALRGNVAPRPVDVKTGNAASAISAAPKPLNIERSSLMNSVTISFTRPIEAGPLPVLLDEAYNLIPADVSFQGESVTLIPAKGFPRYAALDAGVLYRPCAEALPLPCVDFIIDLNSLKAVCAG